MKLTIEVDPGDKALELGDAAVAVQKAMDTLKHMGYRDGQSAEDLSGKFGFIEDEDGGRGRIGRWKITDEQYEHITMRLQRKAKEQNKHGQ